MQNIIQSLIRFTYQPMQEIARLRAAMPTWNQIIAVLVATSLLMLIDPTLYEPGSFVDDLLFNLAVTGPLMNIAITFILAYLFRYLYSLGGASTTLRENALVLAWSSAVGTVLFLPFALMGSLMGEFISMLMLIATALYSFGLYVAAFRELTRASWLHIIGVQLAAGVLIFGAITVGSLALAMVLELLIG